MLRREFLASLAALAAAPRTSWAQEAAEPGMQLGDSVPFAPGDVIEMARELAARDYQPCLLYTSPSPRDLSTSRMPSSA